MELESRETKLREQIADLEFKARVGCVFDVYC